MSRCQYGLSFKKFEEKVPDGAYLLEVKELSLDFGEDINQIIEGENLIALVLLSRDYSGKIDVICIDPPYNTGMEWLTFSDHKHFEEGDDDSHSRWLSFMKKRLDMAYDLMSKNGVLFVNIDENETGSLLLLCHQIFGDDNVDVLIWPKTDTRFDANRVEKPFREIKIVHEYIFACFKDRGNTHLNKIMQPTFKDGRYIDVPSTLETILKGLGTTSSAKDEIGQIFGDRLKFQTPKPVRLIKELIRATSKSDSIILDFFAGSGTTGHAVMDLNREDNGNRQFILVNNNENSICRKITYERLKRVIIMEDYKARICYFKIKN